MVISPDPTDPLEATRVPECPSGLLPGIALEQALDVVRLGFGKVCCPHHAVSAGILLTRAVWKDTLEHAGIQLRPGEVESLAAAYRVPFQVSIEESGKHALAMLEVLGMLLLLGKTPEEHAQVARAKELPP